MPEQSLSNIYFLSKAHYRFLALDSTLALYLGAILNGNIAKKTHKNEKKKKMATSTLNRP